MSSVGKSVNSKSSLKSTTRGRIKTPPINLRFRRDTPGRILIEVRKRYASYLVEDDPLMDWHTTDLHEKIVTSMKPGDWVFHLRDANGLTQEELGQKLGNVSGSRISDWEGNRRAVSKSIAKKLSALFGVSSERFI
jgi:ribosome-binding protein aMBF1 (putative translation factor)